MQDSDWPDVSRIYQQGMDTDLATFESQCPSFLSWNKSHLKFCRLVAIESVSNNNEESIIGWASLAPVSERCVYSGVAEVSVYVDPSKKQQGIGKLLLNEIIKQSEEHGIWTIVSSIMQNNIPSIKLHEACGFRMVGYREKLGKDRYGIWRNTVLMERRSSKI